MKETAKEIFKKAEELFDNEKFVEIIPLLTDKILEIQKSAELFLYKGIGFYYKKDYENAITYYNKAIVINHNLVEAFYNRGLAFVARKKFNDAVSDFDRVIDLESTYADAYVSRGNLKRVLKPDFYEEAISDYSKAIDLNDENAFYYRGLAFYNNALKEKEINIKLLKNSKDDFEKYLELTKNEIDNGTMYANFYINELNVVIKNPKLWSIKQIINHIKDILWINKEKLITHYTSLSVLKNLIFDESKFRISEGNFLNDPSEGETFFKYLKYKANTLHKDSSLNKRVSCKPFIGSFVTNDACDNLNMWRFYGKEKGEEAKGCAITLHKQEFIDNIKDTLSNEKNKEARINYETDINFYRVVYVAQNGATKFYIPNPDKRKDLEILMEKLKEEIRAYINEKEYNSILEHYLNDIAFLFKNDSYKNEDEVRLVMNGIEFKKKYNMGISSPKVYIDLVPIKDIISQIILGPKVDKKSEWKAAFQYCYENNIPKIKFSHLPYK